MFELVLIESSYSALDTFLKLQFLAWGFEKIGNFRNVESVSLHFYNRVNEKEKEKEKRFLSGDVSEWFIKRIIIISINAK